MKWKDGQPFIHILYMIYTHPHDGFEWKDDGGNDTHMSTHTGSFTYYITHTNTHTNIHMVPAAYIHTYIHVHTQPPPPTHPHPHPHPQLHTHTCSHTCSHTDTHTHTLAHTYTHTHTHTHMLTHTHTHTYTQGRVRVGVGHLLQTASGVLAHAHGAFQSNPPTSCPFYLFGGVFFLVMLCCRMAGFFGSYFLCLQTPPHTHTKQHNTAQHNRPTTSCGP
jgi:hypothetical protein